jgi:NAD(P)-dependent dehydrogenase (short-subunit alcohol dehydrogenase family)
MTSSRVALVTGVSSGIGRSTAEALAARGDRVLGTAREVERVEAPAGVELVRLDGAVRTRSAPAWRRCWGAPGGSTCS